jgi:hypothetical protein
MIRKRDRSVGIVTSHELDDRGVEVQFPAGARVFLFSTASRPALGPSSPMDIGALSPRISDRGVKLTTYYM